MEEIIEEMPWMCDDTDCEAQWHLASYWLHPDGSYSHDEFSDGDSEPIDTIDLPSIQEVNEAWNSYYAYVAKTGKDPLKQFLVTTAKNVEIQWRAYFAPWIGMKKFGVLCFGARKNKRGKLVSPDSLPQSAYEYLCLKKRNIRYVCPTFRSVQKMLKLKDTKVRMYRGRILVDFSVVEKIPVAEKQVTRERKRMARKALAA